jgi:hypothetical protein
MPGAGVDNQSTISASAQGWLRARNRRRGRSPNGPGPGLASARVRPRECGSPGEGRTAALRPRTPVQPVQRVARRKSVLACPRTRCHGRGPPLSCGPDRSGRIKSFITWGQQRRGDRHKQGMIAGAPQRLAASAGGDPASRRQNQEDLFVRAPSQCPGDLLRSGRVFPQGVDPGACRRRFRRQCWLRLRQQAFENWRGSRVRHCAAPNAHCGARFGVAPGVRNQPRYQRIPTVDEVKNADERTTGFQDRGPMGRQDPAGGWRHS